MKKLTSLLTLLTLTATMCVSAVPASAIAISYEKNSEEYKTFIEKYTQFDDSDFFKDWGWNGSYYPEYNTYYKVNSSGSYGIVFEEIEDDRFSITVSTKNENYAEIAESAFENFDDAYKVNVHLGGTYSNGVIQETNVASYSVSYAELESEALLQARTVCEELKEAGVLLGFEFYDDMSHPSIISCQYPTVYYAIDTEKADALAEYTKQNNIAGEIVEVAEGDVVDGYTCMFDGYMLVPDGEITAEEHFALAKQIYDDLELRTYMVSPESSTQSYSTVVDMFNVVYGDADNNGEINLYDAVEIAKYMMNMTAFDEVQSFVADFDGNGKVDLYDAVEIAKSLM